MIMRVLMVGSGAVEEAIATLPRADVRTTTIVDHFRQPTTERPGHRGNGKSYILFHLDLPCLARHARRHQGQDG